MFRMTGVNINYVHILYHCVPIFIPLVLFEKIDAFRFHFCVK
jgi:hypothetical protein